MEELYTPDSDFVALAADGQIPLDGNELALLNLNILIAFTTDGSKSNRDFAVMALGMFGPETDKVLAALVKAADDPDVDVRGEAIEGLARRCADVTLPFVQRELAAVECGYGVFVAAGLLATSSLVDLLKKFDKRTDAPWVDDTIRDAISACLTGVPADCR